MAPRALRREVDYPETDGKPMAESDEHRDEMAVYAIQVLQHHFAADRKVYVSGNNLIYFTEGVNADCVSPDTYVVKGVPKRKRRVYKLWEEGGRAPGFVLEITSSSTRREDVGQKMATYRDDLHVNEYFLFDLTRDWIPEGLRGYVLEAGDYRRLAPGASGRLPSQELELDLGILDGHIRFFPPGSDRPLATFEERADEAEAEIARLRAEIDRLKGRRKRRP